MHKILNLGLIISAGLFYPLAFAPFSWWFLAYIAIFLFLYSCKQATPKKVFYNSLIFGLSSFGLGVSWIFVSIHEHGPAPIWLATSLTALFVFFLAMLFALSFYAWAKLFPIHSKLRYCFAFPLFWLLSECIRANIFGGFPWLLLGTAQLHSPLSSLAPIGSVWLMSFVAASLIGCGFQCVSTKNNRLFSLNGLLLFSLLIFASKLFPQWTKATGPAIPIALIQGNIPQPERWDQDYLNKIVNTYMQLSMKVSKETSLIIWPESAIPVDLKHIDPILNILFRARPNLSLITGTIIFGKNKEHYFNALVGLGQANGIYLKEHLVPFGEYVPFESWLRGLIDFFNLPQSAYQSAPAPNAFLNTPTLSLASAICYEIAYPGLVRQRLLAAADGEHQHTAGALLTVSNEAWFGHSFGPYQHLELAQVRAIENQHYVVRATNSGISALINPEGKIEAKLGLEQKGTVEGKIFAMQGSTPWLSFAYWPLGLLISLWALFAFILKDTKLRS